MPETKGEGMKRRTLSLAAAAVAGALVLAGSLPAMAQPWPGSTTCANTHRQGIDSKLGVSAPSNGKSSHYYNSTGHHVEFTGTSSKRSYNGLTSSGAWNVYSDHNVSSAVGFCALKPS